MAIEDVDIMADPDRLVSFDLGSFSKDDEITVTVDGETFSGPITRIDTCDILLAVNGEASHAV
ncbi:hypothetical protein, partial [Halocatena pleomorpha]